MHDVSESNVPMYQNTQMIGSTARIVVKGVAHFFKESVAVVRQRAIGEDARPGERESHLFFPFNAAAWIRI